MKLKTLLFSTACAFWACASLSADEPTVSSIKLSQPGQPATVRIHVAQGNVKVGVNDTNDTVTVRTSAMAEEPAAPRADGLRVLSTGQPSFHFTEDNNVVVLDYGRDLGPTAPDAEFVVQVPRTASVEIANTWRADVQVDDLEGDIDIKTMQGSIKLNNLSGAALVETMNGGIEASFAKVPEGKPLSFTSMNGKIEIRVPDTTKANVRFRTQNGSILTDFPENALKIRTENQGFSPAHASEAARIASEAGREAARVAREVASEIRKAMREGGAETGDAPQAPRPPRPPSIPAMVGGKVVSGTLNGGGSEVQAATMNGDIIVRQHAP